MFNENEPSDTYYTTDGSTPTSASTQYQLAGFREQEGATLTFTQTTTLKWFSVDPKGNTSAIQTATFIVDAVPPTTTASLCARARQRLYAPPDRDADRDRPDDSGMHHEVLAGRRPAADVHRAVPGDRRRDRTRSTYCSSDNAGNVEATNSLAFKVDATDPTISIDRPGRRLARRARHDRRADYDCDDATSGEASCVGTVASGDPIDTSTVGTHTFTVQAADNAGNTASMTVSYDVVYNVWTGFGPPIIDGGTTTRNGGSVRAHSLRHRRQLRARHLRRRLSEARSR